MSFFLFLVAVVSCCPPPFSLGWRSRHSKNGRPDGSLSARIGPRQRVCVCVSTRGNVEDVEDVEGESNCSGPSQWLLVGPGPGSLPTTPAAPLPPPPSLGPATPKSTTISVRQKVNSTQRARDRTRKKNTKWPDANEKINGNEERGRTR